MLSAKNYAETLVLDRCEVMFSVLFLFCSIKPKFAFLMEFSGLNNDKVEKPKWKIHIERVSFTMDSP